MARLVQWACRAAAGVVALVLLTAVASIATAASGTLGSLHGAPTADPVAQANTDQILGVVRGVAAEAGSSYTRSASGSGPTPVGGVQTGFGGGVAPATGLSPVVLLTLLLAVTFALVSIYVEVRRRRSAAER